MKEDKRYLNYLIRPGSARITISLAPEGKVILEHLVDQRGETFSHGVRQVLNAGLRNMTTHNN